MRLRRKHCNFSVCEAASVDQLFREQTLPWFTAILASQKEMTLTPQLLNFIFIDLNATTLEQKRDIRDE
jgi:hypothetical protein